MRVGFRCCACGVLNFFPRYWALLRALPYSQADFLIGSLFFSSVAYSLLPSLHCVPLVCSPWVINWFPSLFVSSICILVFVVILVYILYRFFVFYSLYLSSQLDFLIKSSLNPKRKINTQSRQNKMSWGKYMMKHHLLITFTYQIGICTNAENKQSN